MSAATHTNESTARSFLASVALVSVACAEGRGLTLGDEASELDLFVVALAIEGSPVTVALRAPSIPAVLEGNTELVIFGFSTSDFVGPDGASVSDAELSGLVARSARRSGARSTCDTCTAASRRAPQVVFPGDSCALPAFARVFVSQPGNTKLVEVRPGEDVEAEALRSQIRMDWPGECANRDEVVPTPPRSSRFEVLYPKTDPWPIEVVAQTADGTIGLFSEKLALRVGPSGERIEARAPFVGPTQLAVGLRDGRFIVGSRAEARDGPRAEFYQFDAGSFESHRLETNLADSDLPRDLVYAAEAQVARLGAPAGSEVLVVAGGRSVVDPWASLCVLSASLTCTPILSGQADVEWTGGGERLTEAVVLEDGTVAVVGGTRLGFGAPGANGWAWGSREPAVEGFELESLGAVGQQVFVCAEGDGLGSRILTATITRDMGGEGHPGPEFVERFAYPRTVCGDFWSVPGSPRRLRMTLGTTSIELDADRLNQEPRQLGDILGATHYFEWVRSLTVDRILAKDAAGVILQSGPTGLQPVYGPRELAGRPGALIATDAGFAGYFNDPPGTFEVKRVDGSWNFEIQPPVTGLADSADVITGAVTDSTDGSVWLVGFTRTATSVRGWLRHQRTDAVVEVGSVAGLRGIDIAEVAPGVFVILADNWGIWVLDHEILRPVELIWDDSATSESEGRPEPAVLCPDRLSSVGGPFGDPPLQTWRAVEARDGVAWAVGCSGVVARVTAFGSAPFAERMFSEDLTGGLSDGDGKPPALTVVRVVSPSRVLVGAEGRTRATAERGRLWEIRAGPLGLAALKNEDLRHPLPALAFTSGAPFAILGEPSALAIVTTSEADGSFQFLGSSLRLRFPAPLTAAASHQGDVLLVGPGLRVLRVAHDD
ncbi:MAG: hypothetical protein HY791_03995 [Deltaproteobacteria bacterium]|nr:hypothetical protein [Deltaproteobacteria bacterium]